MDPLKMLEDDHETVKKILGDLEDTTERAVKSRTELFGRLEREMRVHEVLEEEILYPALKEHDKAKDLALEGYEEHHVVDTIMGEMRDVSVEDETWTAKFSVMKENIEHHIEEEEGEMFPKAREIFSADELEEMGERMAARRKEAQAALP
ncbi:MAG TPA: hemerythrin domain-containing protein [Actinomycetota bacterium]|nr:hemerythrin domain-containing protein [Actinomycetota bacterium]